MLPEDAYTGVIKAKYQLGNLCVEVMRKDPIAPAMVEKRVGWLGVGWELVG